jgi:hypothetical protein
MTFHWTLLAEHSTGALKFQFRPPKEDSGKKLQCEPSPALSEPDPAAGHSPH